MLIRLGHSPDPDDAFMFYGLAAGKIDTGPFQFQHILEDIQTLNRRATNGELEITALSVHAYAYVRDKYQLTRCGGSFGRDYGPMIVARDIFDIIQIPHKTIAVPGEMTTAFLLLRLICQNPLYRVVPFDQIIQAVQTGEVDAGLIIHEGQLTYQQAGLECVLDLGRWWQHQTHLPLPLGVNAVRRDLGPTVARQLSDILLASIRYGLEHRPEAVDYALQFARDMQRDLADQFVGMYVNDLTLDPGPAGRKAIDLLLQRAADNGIIPSPVPVDWI